MQELEIKIPIPIPSYSMELGPIPGHPNGPLVTLRKKAKNSFTKNKPITHVCKNAGVVCGPASLVNSMMDLHQGALMLLGPTMNAKVAFEISERLPHLSLRMKEHCQRAMLYATRMNKLGLKVIYPGLECHPQHELLKSMANKGYGYGGILCVDMESEERANRLMHLLQNHTQFGLMAVSLGYYETLMSCSGSSTSSEMNADEKERAGISPGLVRMSVGYSGTIEQRWAQFEKAYYRLQEMGNTVHNGMF